MLKLRPVLFTLLALLILVSGFSSSAQSQEIPDLLAQAFANLSALEGYHYESVSTVVTTYSNSDGVVATNTGIYSTNGIVAGNGDNATTFSIDSSSETEGSLDTFLLDRVVTEGETYVRLNTQGTAFEAYFNVEPGWWRYEDLRVALNNDSASAFLDTILLRPLPSKSPGLQPQVPVRAVYNRGTDTFQGKPMQVFDVEFNGPELMQQNPLKDLPAYAAFYQTVDLMEGTTFHATAKLWIGVDDAQIYRFEASTKVTMPFATEGYATVFPYDLIQSDRVTLTLSEQGQPVEISKPSPVHE